MIINKKSAGKYFLTIGSLLVIIAVGVWWYLGKTEEVKKSTEPAPQYENQERSLVAKVVYVCSHGKTIEAAFYKGKTLPVKPGEPPIPTGSVDIVLDGGEKLFLPQTISADGGRYATSDESFVFWSKGDGAIVLENGVEKNYSGCIVK